MKPTTRRTANRAAAALAAIAAVALAGPGAGAPPAGGKPAGAPAGAPAATKPAIDPAAMKVLADLEAAGAKHTTIRADIHYHVLMRQLGDSETRTGWVAFQRADGKSPTKFRITFDTLQQGAGRKIRAQVDYAFDGQWLTVAKHRIKSMTHYQIAAKGQRVEPLRIGRGPFPLPFGQKVADVIKYFQPTTRPPAATDPKGTTCLRLVTRPEHAKSLSLARLEMWIDAGTHLPVKIRTRDKNRNVTTVTFAKIRTNRQVPSGVFAIPHKVGWDVTRRPLKKAGKLLP